MTYPIKSCIGAVRAAQKYEYSSHYWIVQYGFHWPCHLAVASCWLCECPEAKGSFLVYFRATACVLSAVWTH